MIADAKQSALYWEGIYSPSPPRLFTGPPKNVTSPPRVLALPDPARNRTTLRQTQHHSRSPCRRARSLCRCPSSHATLTTAPRPLHSARHSPSRHPDLACQHFRVAQHQRVAQHPPAGATCHASCPVCQVTYAPRDPGRSTPALRPAADPVMRSSAAKRIRPAPNHFLLPHRSLYRAASA